MKDIERPYEVNFDRRAGLETSSAIESATDEDVREESHRDLRSRSMAAVSWRIPGGKKKKPGKGKAKPAPKKRPRKKRTTKK